MIIDKHLYIGGMPKVTAIKTLLRVKRLKRGPSVMLVTLPVFESGILEIYDLNELTQKLYKPYVDDIHVVGISLTRRNAYRLVRDIIDDVYTSTGSFDVKNYFENYKK